MESGVFLGGGEQMRVGTNEKGEKRRTGSVYVAGVRIRHLPVSETGAFVCILPQYEHVCVFVCV